MTGILYTDLQAILIPRLQALVDADAAAYMAGIKVANAAVTGYDRFVTVVDAGGAGARNTVDSEYLALNVHAKGEGDCRDISARIRWIITATGSGHLVDGNPIVYCGIITRPAAVETATDFHRMRMVAEFRRRGTQM
jgi:hypothetical protein